MQRLIKFKVFLDRKNCRSTKRNYMIKILITLFTLGLLIAVSSASIDAKMLNDRITEKGLNWSARDNNISSLSMDAKKMLLGLSDEAPQVNLSGTKPAAYNYPSEYNLRKVNGSDFCTGIRDQSGCGSCVAFAVTAAVESSYEVYNSNPSANLDLSEWDLFTRGGSCSAGWMFVPALEALRKYGICRESCYPYLTDEPRCAERSSQLVRIGSYKQLSSLDEVKWWVANKGPVITGMQVYEDFFNYNSGIYTATYGAFMGNHAVAVVGYSDNGKYWICKNSWGTLWGESGWFRISYTADTGFGSLGYYGLEFASSQQPPNEPDQPSGATKCVAGSSYSFMTSATDPAKNKVQYTFDWGDGTTNVTDFVDSGTSANASHIWSPTQFKSTYYVRARATNNKSLSSDWSSYLAVQIIDPSNRAPQTPSIPSGPASGKENIYYSFTTSATDAEGDRVKYTFDWGDGTQTATWLVSSGKASSAFHKWTAVGSYQVKAMATDSQGASSGWSEPLIFTIPANRPPAAPASPSGPVTGKENTYYSFTTSASDADGDKVKCTIDWGDATKSVTWLANSGTVVKSSHKWTSAGEYQIRAMATDSKGASSGWSEPLNFTIPANRPPETPAKPSGSDLGKARTYYSFATSAKDLEGDKVKFTFDWGDKTQSTTRSVNSGASLSSFHRWTAPGTYQVRAMATDGKGAASDWSEARNITISASSKSSGSTSAISESASSKSTRKSNTIRQSSRSVRHADS